MPVAPIRPCKYCKRLNCTSHDTKKTSDRRRGSSTQRGYDYQWRKFSEAYRQRNPICRDPYAHHSREVRPTDQTDHIVPLERGGAKYDEANLQPLCDECHSYKTAIEDGGFGNGAVTAERL